MPFFRGGIMSAKVWRPFAGECLHCGGSAEVLTDSGKDNVAYDGDRVRCTRCRCPGVVTIDEPADHEDYEWTAHVDWHDEPSCACEWCRAHPCPA